MYTRQTEKVKCEKYKLSMAHDWTEWIFVTQTTTKKKEEKRVKR